MPKIPALNRVLIQTALAWVIFGLLVWLAPVRELIVLLNGLFVGSAVAIIVAYWKLLWYAILGIRPYDRVRQMTIGFFLCWLAYVLGVMVSIYLRSTGAITTPIVLTAASRYVAIIAAVLQVTAPDFGLGIFHGRDRKTLWTGISLGGLVAIAAIWMQAADALAA